MNQLIDTGASMFLVVNLPDLGKTPKLNKDAAISAQATQLTVTVNQSLEAMLQSLEAANPELEISRLDAFSLMQDTFAASTALGYTNIGNAQYSQDSGTVAAGTYFFWDDIHPTTYTHRILADAAAAQLTCENCTGGPPQIGMDLTITVPYAELGTDAYGFRLDYCENPAADPTGFYWKLDAASLTAK
jgi:phospholipase/lecithinase/hemolysin